METKNICSICLEDNNNCNEMLFDCVHIFHKNCISKWKNNSCPNCRSKKKTNFEMNFNNLYYLLSTNSKKLPINDYSSKNINCSINNHKLEVYQSRSSPFGVILFCLDCKITTCCSLINYM